MTTYYNEIEPYAVAWLRNLIAEGLIAPGEVDERSIEDVRPSDLAGFTQCHFFAGIGVWSLALRSAGWPDDRPVWTGSCPCQPFSSAGKGGGFADERHLWPAFHHLIRVCRPDVVLGEQVASKDGLAWLDLVQADLEGEDYAFGALDTCAAGFGAPHIRQRLYWVADAPSGGRRKEQPDGGRRVAGDGEGETVLHSGRGSFGGVADDHGVGRKIVGEPGVRRAAVHDAHGRGAEGGMGDAGGAGLARRLGVGGVPRGEGGSSAREAPFGTGVHAGGVADAEHSAEHGNPGAVHRPQVPHASDRWGGRRPVGTGETGGVAYTANLAGPQEPARNDAIDEQRPENGRRSIVATGPRADGGNIHGNHSAGRGEIRPTIDMAGVGRPGPTNGLWRDPDWIYCRDGRWRPVESGTFPLAHGAPARVGRLRAYGNAVTLGQAQAFIEAVDYTRRVRLTAVSDFTGDVFS